MPAEPVDSEPSDQPLDAGEVRRRGEPLLEALEAHAAGARDRADSVGTYAFAIAVALGRGRDDAELVREAARLSSVGGIYVAPELLLSDPAEAAERSPGELAKLQQSGYRLCLAAAIPQRVAAWVLGDAAPDPEPEARMIAVARATAALLAAGAERPAQRLREPERGLDADAVAAIAPLLERSPG